MKSPCCEAQMVEVPSEFIGDYTLQCPHCGGWFEDTQWDGMTARDFLIAESRLQEIVRRG